MDFPTSDDEGQHQHQGKKRKGTPGEEEENEVSFLCTSPPQEDAESQRPKKKGQRRSIDFDFRPPRIEQSKIKDTITAQSKKQLTVTKMTFELAQQFRVPIVTKFIEPRSGTVYQISNIGDMDSFEAFISREKSIGNVNVLEPKHFQRILRCNQLPAIVKSSSAFGPIRTINSQETINEYIQRLETIERAFSVLPFTPIANDQQIIIEAKETIEGSKEFFRKIQKERKELALDDIEGEKRIQEKEREYIREKNPSLYQKLFAKDQERQMRLAPSTPVSTPHEPPPVWDVRPPWTRDFDTGYMWEETQYQAAQSEEDIPLEEVPLEDIDYAAYFQRDETEEDDTITASTTTTTTTTAAASGTTTTPVIHTETPLSSFDHFFNIALIWIMECQKSLSSYSPP